MTCARRMGRNALSQNHMHTKDSRDMLPRVFPKVFCHTSQPTRIRTTQHQEHRTENADVTKTRVHAEAKCRRPNMLFISAQCTALTRRPHAHDATQKQSATNPVQAAVQALSLKVIMNCNCFSSSISRQLSLCVVLFWQIPTGLQRPARFCFSSVWVVGPLSKAICSSRRSTSSRAAAEHRGPCHTSSGFHPKFGFLATPREVSSERSHVGLVLDGQFAPSTQSRSFLLTNLRGRWSLSLSMPVRIRQQAQAPRPRALLTTPPCEAFWKVFTSLSVLAIGPSTSCSAAFHELDHPSSDVQAYIRHLTKPCFTERRSTRDGLIGKICATLPPASPAHTAPKTRSSCVWRAPCNRVQVALLRMNPTARTNSSYTLTESVRILTSLFRHGFHRDHHHLTRCQHRWLSQILAGSWTQTHLAVLFELRRRALPRPCVLSCALRVWLLRSCMSTWAFAGGGVALERWLLLLVCCEPLFFPRPCWTYPVWCRRTVANKEFGRAPSPWNPTSSCATNANSNSLWCIRELPCTMACCNRQFRSYASTFPWISSCGDAVLAKTWFNMCFKEWPSCRSHCGRLGCGVRWGIGGATRLLRFPLPILSPVALLSLDDRVGCSVGKVVANSLLKRFHMLGWDDARVSFPGLDGSMSPLHVCDGHLVLGRSVTWVLLSGRRPT